MSNKTLQKFINDVKELEIDFIRYEINNTDFIISVTVSDDGFHCELLYSPNEVDDLFKYVFIKKEERDMIASTITNFYEYAKNNTRKDSL